MVGHRPALHHRCGPDRLGSQGGRARERGLQPKGQALGSCLPWGTGGTAPAWAPTGPAVSWTLPTLQSPLSSQAAPPSSPCTPRSAQEASASAAGLAAQHEADVAGLLPAARPQGRSPAAHRPQEPRARARRALGPSLPGPLPPAVATQRTSPTAAFLAGCADTMGLSLQESPGWRPQPRPRPPLRLQSALSAQPWGEDGGHSLSDSTPGAHSDVALPGGPRRPQAPYLSWLPQQFRPVLWLTPPRAHSARADPTSTQPLACV